LLLPNLGSSVLRYRKRFDRGRGIKIHFQNEWSFIDNARNVLRAKEKPLNRAFRQTDRLRRAISVPPVDITLSLFTSMMLGRSEKKEGTRQGRSGIRRNDDSEVFVSDCLRKIHVQGKRTVDIETWNQLVSRDTSSCLASAFVVIELRGCCYVTFYPRSVSRENPTERCICFHLSRSSIVTKWNEAPSVSRWPTIESCNSKC